MAELRLTRFSAEHLEPCARLYLTVFNEAPWFDHWTLQTADARIGDLFASPGFCGWVALQDGNPAGFAAGRVEQWFDARHFYLAEMCVRTDLQRAGIGGRLLRMMETDLAAAGVSRVYLQTMKGGPGEQFYRKHGYYGSLRMTMMAKRLEPGTGS
jgi:aminoglycoside 6'-N-acetyltransferase I